MGGRRAWIGRGSGGWIAAAESGVPGADDGLVPVGYLEFAEDRGDVVGDGLGGDRHLPGDLGVARAGKAGQRHVIAMHGGFHGKTLGALSVTGRAVFRDPFGPLLPMVDFVPFGDLAALRAALTAQSVVLLEPVQAEGGVRLPPDGYLRQVRQACTETGAAMILDEIQSGLGRLGAWWGADLAGVTPDAVLTGKILSGGVMPVGGVVASAQLFAPLNADPLLPLLDVRGSPLAAAAVTATIGAIKSEGLIGRARELGPLVRDLAANAVTRRTARTWSPRCAARACSSGSTSSRPTPPPSS